MDATDVPIAAEVHATLDVTVTANPDALVDAQEIAKAPAIPDVTGALAAARVQVMVVAMVLQDNLIR